VEVAAAVRAVMNGEAFCPQSLLLSLFEYAARPHVKGPTAKVKRNRDSSRREQQLTKWIGKVSRI